MDDNSIVDKVRRLRTSGRLEDAEQLCEQEIVRLNRLIARLLTEQSHVVQKQSNNNQAMELLERAVLYDPSYRAAYNARMMLFSSTERWSLAIKDAYTLMQLDKAANDRAFSDFAAVYLGYASLQVMDHQAAKDSYSIIEEMADMVTLPSINLSLSEIRLRLRSFLDDYEQTSGSS